MKPRVPPNVYPTDKNGLFSNAGGSDFFLANNNNKYANADIVSENTTHTEPAQPAQPAQANQGTGAKYRRK